MLWIIFALLSYFLLALSSILDKIILNRPSFGPKIYAFLAGAAGGIASFIIIPFVSFDNLVVGTVFLGFLSGAIWVLALFFLYLALKKYETSRIIPAIGGFVPIFMLGFSLLYSRIAPQGLYYLNFGQILSFIFLVTGGVFININREKTKNNLKESLIFSAISALLFAFSFFLSKIVYMEISFLTGLFLRLFGSFFTALFFVFAKETRNYLSTLAIKKEKMKKTQQKTIALFLTNQLISIAAGFFQNLSLFFVPMFFLAFVGALEGTKYIFILTLASIISYKWPDLFLEKISRKILIQKAIATGIIIFGLILFAFNARNL